MSKSKPKPKPSPKKKSQDHSATVESLVSAIGQAARSASFCVDGCLSANDPGIAVEGLGGIRFPLKPAVAKSLIARCQAAPYGKGTQTLVNKHVRSTLELDPARFRVSDAWNAAIAGAMRPVAEELGLPEDRLEARLYKLLVYEKGGFFVPHRDSEKHDRMVASLIVVLPNRFEGGRLVVRHGAAVRKLAFEDAAAGERACYAAFYADCEHEVERVTRGVRVCLAYNLVLRPQQGKRSAAAHPADPVDVLAEALAAWVARQPAKPLVFALDHHYTQRSLSLDLLKGADRQRMELVVPAAAKAGCLVHLAQVSRHLVQFADDGSFARGYYRGYSAPRRALEIGETYEDDLTGTEWTDGQGKKQPWGSIPFELSAIVSSLPIDDWKPTSEEFEGYTGNAGNTLDRWYHRSALVVWHRNDHFDVVAASGTAASIPLFCSMAARLARTARKRREEARNDCIRLARAIIARWPYHTHGYGAVPSREKSPSDDFAERLLELHDRDTIAQFLTMLAERDPTQRLSSLVPAACREFGWTAFAQELKGLISSGPNRYGQDEIPFRDLEWLSAFCCDETVDPDKSALAHELCALAVDRFCAPRPPQPAYGSSSYRRPASVSETALPHLLEALAASGCDEDLARAIRFVEETPDEFRMDVCQVPCLKTLIRWSRRELGRVPPPLAAWLASVRRQLELATASPPAPPTNWARPADVACKCEYCTKLRTFLSDPAQEVARIPAREDRRQHLIDSISRHECDVKYALERKGSPYSLVLTKTRGSFERAVKRFELNRQLLSALPTIS